MRANSHSPFATALLLIPIFSIPLLAIFGVPQFAPLVPSALDHRNRDSASSRSEAPPFASDSSTDWPEVGSAQTVATNVSQSAWNDVAPDATARALADRRAEGEFLRDATAASAPQTGAVVPIGYEESGTVRLGTAQPMTRDQTATATDGAGPPLVEPPNRQEGNQRLSRQAASQPATSRNSTVGARGAPSALTWQTAVRRLNELEIRNFRLEPGQQPEQFVFICSYTPQDNPRVSYRFEAEADEPLRAVEKVLAQIDAWLAGR